MREGKKETKHRQVRLISTDFAKQIEGGRYGTWWCGN